MSNRDKKAGNTVDIEKFAQRYGYSVGTIKRKFDKIAGAYREGKFYIIPDSSRYPYNLGNTKLKKREDKMYIVLRATSLNKYVDNNMVRLSKASFSTLLNELVSLGFLLENGSKDENGANAYDTSVRADEMLRKKKWEVVVEISKAVAEVSGAFAREYYK